MFFIRSQSLLLVSNIQFPQTDFQFPHFHLGKVETFSGMTYLFVSSVVVKNCTVRQHYTVDFAKPLQKYSKLHWVSPEKIIPH